jgi:lysyl-tRNA synthetase class 2
MLRTEEIFIEIAKMLNKEKIEFNGNKISLKAPFTRINMVDVVNEKTNKDFRNISLVEAKEVAKNHGIKLKKYYKLGHIINDLFEELIEKTLIQPTFVIGYPIETSPFATKNKKDKRFTDRAELFINGKEYANMFNEINDPIDQLERFESQFKERKSGNKEANEIDMEFIKAIEHGMPPAGGCGIGIDRLIMLFTSKKSIREVLLFPHLKNKNK